MTNNVPLTSIESITFGPLHDALLEQISAVTVNTPGTFNIVGEPIIGSSVDSKLGTIDYKYNCGTCYLSKTDCPGHVGMLNLNIPFINPTAESYVISWLRIICHKCSRIFAKGITLNSSSSNNRVCRHADCGYVQPKIVVPTPAVYVVIVNEKVKDTTSKKNKGASKAHKLANGRKWFPHEFKHVIDRISIETLRELKVPEEAHPRYFINYKFAISSIVTHPDVKQIGSNSRTSHDPITTYYSEIITLNSTISPIVGRNPATSNEHSQIDMTEERRNLETQWFHLLALIYNCIKDASNKNAELGFSIANTQSEAQSILSRLKSKTGYIRNNQLGKAAFFMGRGVIVGDPTIDIDTIVIPMSFARKLQMREVVQRYNYKEMSVYFNNGYTDIYPRATSIIKKSTGLTHTISASTQISINLEIGDIIFRDLIDGDYVLFNRMPTLYYASINRMRIIVDKLANITYIKVNELILAPFGADFDGDEMNVILLQSAAARAEINILSNIYNWFNSYQRGTPHLSHIQDTVLAPAKLTKSGVTFNINQVLRLFASIDKRPVFDATRYPADYVFTGREVMSLVLAKVNYRAKTNYHNGDDEGVSIFDPYINYAEDEKVLVIKDGVVVSGICDSSFKGYYQEVLSEYGAKVAIDTMHYVQQLSAGVLSILGSSIGINDLVISRESSDRIKLEIESLMQESKITEDQLLDNAIVPSIGITVDAYVEKKMLAILKSDFLDVVMRAVRTRENNFLTMLLTGSTGAYHNLVQLTACVGQLDYGNNRLERKYSYMRPLPYCHRFTTRPEDRGFVKGSILGGLTPTELFAMARIARNSIYQKTSQTANTGYQSRITCKNLESIILTNNSFCESENFKIVQMRFGDNGFDTRKIEYVKIPYVTLSDADFEAQYNFDPEEFAQLSVDRETYRREFLLLAKTMLMRMFSDKIGLPVNITRIIRNIKHETRLDLVSSDETIAIGDIPEAAQAELREMRKMLRDYIADMPYIYYSESLRQRKGYVGDYSVYGVRMIALSLRAYLHTREFIELMKKPAGDASNTDTASTDKANLPGKYVAGRGKIILADILARVNINMLKNLVDYGSAIGVICALCISEPITQLTLHSIHVKAKDTAKTSTKSDFAHLKNIFGLTPAEKCVDPIMRIAIKPGTTKARAVEIANILEMMTLRQFVKSHQVFYEDFGNPIHSEYIRDKRIIDDFIAGALIKPPRDLLKICLRFEINVYTTISKNISIQDIILGLTKHIDLINEYYLIYSSENDSEGNIFIRVYFQKNMNISSISGADKVAEMLLDTTIRGVQRIISAGVETFERRYLIKETGAISGEKDKRDEYMIRAYGVNYPGVYALQLKIPEIDYDDITSDNVAEIYEHFGLTAARIGIINELHSIMKDLHYSLFTIIADTMISTGKLTPITPNGPVYRKSSTLLKFSFEKAISVLSEAIKTNAVSTIHGLSSSLVIGQVPNIGSNYNKIILNAPYIIENTKTIGEELDAL